MQCERERDIYRRRSHWQALTSNIPCVWRQRQSFSRRARRTVRKSGYALFPRTICIKMFNTLLYVKQECRLPDFFSSFNTNSARVATQTQELRKRIVRNNSQFTARIARRDWPDRDDALYSDSFATLRNIPPLFLHHANWFPPKCYDAT